MKENSIEEDITRIKQRIEDVKEYIEYGLPYSEYLDLENSFDNILSDYKRVLKENEKLKKKIDLMENYMVENGWEICFDNIYAELNNCNGMERDWCRGDELEKQDIHKYFSKKLLESEE